MGFMDDFRKGAEKGKGESKDRPPAEFAKVHTWHPKHWLLAIFVGIPAAFIVLIVGFAITASEDQNSDTSTPEPELVQADGFISCPTQLFVGLPVDLNVTMENSGAVPYPRTFLALEDGFDDFTVNSIRSDGLNLTPADFPGFDRTYQSGKVAANGTRRFTITATPITAGNITLSVWGWADEGDTEGLVPDDPAIYECPDVPVNP